VQLLKNTKVMKIRISRRLKKNNLILLTNILYQNRRIN